LSLGSKSKKKKQQSAAAKEGTQAQAQQDGDGEHSRDYLVESGGRQDSENAEDSEDSDDSEDSEDSEESEDPWRPSPEIFDSSVKHTEGDDHAVTETGHKSLVEVKKEKMAELAQYEEEFGPFANSSEDDNFTHEYTACLIHVEDGVRAIREKYAPFNVTGDSLTNEQERANYRNRKDCRREVGLYLAEEDQKWDESRFGKERDNDEIVTMRQEALAQAVRERDRRSKAKVKAKVKTLRQRQSKSPAKKWNATKKSMRASGQTEEMDAIARRAHGVQDGHTWKPRGGKGSKKRQTKKTKKVPLAVMQAVRNKPPPPFRPTGYVRKSEREGYVKKVDRPDYVRPSFLRDEDSDLTEESTSSDNYTTGDSLEYDSQGGVDWEVTKLRVRSRQSERAAQASASGTESGTESFDGSDSQQQDGGTQQDEELEPEYLGAYEEKGPLQQCRCVLGVFWHVFFLWEMGVGFWCNAG